MPADSQSTQSLATLADYSKVSGMSQAAPSHMMPDGLWWFANNCKFDYGRITQTPPITPLWTISGSDATRFTQLVPYVSSTFAASLAAISGKGLYALNFGSQTAVKVMEAGLTIDTLNQYPWSVLQASNNSGGLYYANQLNGIWLYTGGASATQPVVSVDDPFPEFIEEFYNHLVVANTVEAGTKFPLRLRYSDLNDYTNFTGTNTNEADVFDIGNNPLNGQFGLGITGLKRMGTICAIYTCGSIWNMQYVGFDNGVMEITEQINGIGCWIPNCLVGVDRFHVFPALDNFYMYDGNACYPIGDDIKRFFYADITPDPVLRAQSWSYVDSVSQTLNWYYPSKYSTSGCDRHLVFNWQARRWYYLDGLSRTAALTGGARVTTWIDLLTQFSLTIDGLVTASSTIDGLAKDQYLPSGLFLDTSGATLKTEKIQSDTKIEPSIKQFPQVVLETGDMTFGDPNSIKLISQLYLDADVFPAAAAELSLPGATYGWQIWCLPRDYVCQPVDNTKYLFCGLYKPPTRPNAPLAFTFPNRVNGRVFRFKFISSNLGFSTFYGYAPVINTSTQGK